MRAGRAERNRGPRRQLLAAIVLAALTCPIPLQLISSLLPASRVCAARNAAHASVLAASLLLPNATVPQAVENAQRQAASTFLRLNARSKSCRPIRITRAFRRALEYALYSHHAIDGTLLYLISLLGIRSHLVVEVDGAKKPSLLSAVLAVRRSCRVIALYESWIGYDMARKFYEPIAADRSRVPEVRPDVIEIRSVVGEELSVLLRREHAAGRVDVLSLLSVGSEVPVIKSMVAINGPRPRLLIAFYQDFWGHKLRMSRTLTKKDSKGMHSISNTRYGTEPRLDAGASIASLVDVARRAGFRLVWCTARAPLAFFVDVRGRVGDGTLATISPKKCIKERGVSLAWRRDMEARWDEAQRYKWNNFR